MTDSSQHTILIVDDEPELLHYLRDYLAEHFDLLTADSGDTGYAIACKEKIDCIISDVNMPGLDGLQLTKKLKSNPETFHIPIILVSAQKAERDLVLGQESMADLYLSKPFRNEELLVAIFGLISGAN
jgi:DNA-binding response OmpR family regulator